MEGKIKRLTENELKEKLIQYRKEESLEVKKQLQEEIFLSLKKLVIFIAGEMVRAKVITDRVEFEDIVSVGNSGVLKAINSESFDPEKTSFVTYAGKAARNAINAELNKLKRSDKDISISVIDETFADGKKKNDDEKIASNINVLEVALDRDTIRWFKKILASNLLTVEEKYIIGKKLYQDSDIERETLDKIVPKNLPGKNSNYEILNVAKKRRNALVKIKEELKALDRESEEKIAEMVEFEIDVEKFKKVKSFSKKEQEKFIDILRTLNKEEKKYLEMAVGFNYVVEHSPVEMAKMLEKSPKYIARIVTSGINTASEEIDHFTYDRLSKQHHREWLTENQSRKITQQKSDRIELF